MRYLKKFITCYKILLVVKYTLGEERGRREGGRDEREIERGCESKRVRESSVCVEKEQDNA